MKPSNEMPLATELSNIPAGTFELPPKEAPNSALVSRYYSLGQSKF